MVVVAGVSGSSGECGSCGRHDSGIAVPRVSSESLVLLAFGKLLSLETLRGPTPYTLHPIKLLP